MQILLVILLWLAMFFSPEYEPEHWKALFPDNCAVHEDGAVICPWIKLPPYTDVFGN
jgi:hypothetical protein